VELRSHEVGRHLNRDIPVVNVYAEYLLAMPPHVVAKLGYFGRRNID
jgi:hypothetical protein